MDYSVVIRAVDKHASGAWVKTRSGLVCVPDRWCPLCTKPVDAEAALVFIGACDHSDCSH